ncbi:MULTISPECIES: phosphocarrier protein HPr domain protein [Enterococcus]|uniref:phosphocarrier protein HPr domain protein n=1 Tax=Enterococcus TaxID=1350 RepID=UPI00124D9D37|nr:MULTISPECIES: phosphocarrier protein HPr domain protein [Enterococcus]GER76641.1 hypothetical protein EsFM111_14230 [Enterococcus sp. FM11-1]
MVSMTIFWCVIGAIVATLGILLINANEENKGSGSLIGTILLIVGILVAIGAEINLYLNGTTEELMWFLLWTRR